MSLALLGADSPPPPARRPEPGSASGTLAALGGLLGGIVALVIWRGAAPAILGAGAGTAVGILAGSLADGKDGA